MKTMPCGCRWDGHELHRCARHREAGSLARDLMVGRPNPIEAILSIRAADLSAVAEAPAWMFESALHHALWRKVSRHRVRETVEALLGAWDSIPEAMRRQMCDDIYAAVLQGSAGAPCDVKQWERVLAREVSE